MHNQYINIYLPFITIGKIKLKNNYDTIQCITGGIKSKRKKITSFDKDVDQKECSNVLLLI